MTLLQTEALDGIKHYKKGLIPKHALTQMQLSTIKINLKGIEIQCNFFF